ncbi:MAG TPA: hypothetical protein VH275_02365 [Solirubrobacterales bacterium]|jgi:hypothetical protein|nr:hypothetical protein [Solirubrobacterales bacterium]
MRSIRKISLLAAVVAVAIAAAAPAAASAYKLEYSNGQNLAVGDMFSLNSNNWRIGGPGGLYSTCANVTLGAEATKNTEASAEAVNAGFGLAETCFYKNQSLPTEIKLIGLKFSGSTTGTITLKVTQDWGEGHICKREGALPMTFTPGTSVIKVKGNFPGSWCLTENNMVGDFSLSGTYPFPGQPIIIK